MSAALLSALPVGAEGRVTNVRVNVDPNVAIRILEMGLVPGTLVRVVGTAPLGDPIELEVRGYRLSLRRQEAALVEIAPPS